MTAWILATVGCMTDAERPPRPHDEPPPPVIVPTEPTEPPPVEPPTTPPEPVDLPCDGEGSLDTFGCEFDAQDADATVAVGEITLLPDLTNDGVDDAWRQDLDAVYSYHSSDRDYQVTFWPDVLADPEASFVIDSRASDTQAYSGTHRGIERLLAAGDATGDGQPDLWAATHTGWWLVPGPIDATIGDPEQVGVEVLALLSAAGDFDGDGTGDLLLDADDMQPRATICLGPLAAPLDGTGCTFVDVDADYDASTLPYPATDMDGDGADEIVKVYWSSAHPSPEGVYSGYVVAFSGASPDGPAVPVLEVDTETSFKPVSLAAADFDGDGYGDFAWVTASEDEAVVVRGPFSDTVLGPADATTTFEGSALRFGEHADVDGDGAEELAVTSAGTGGVALVHLLDDGVLAPLEVAYHFLPDADEVRLDFGDLDGDGEVDVLAQDGSGTAYVFLHGTLWR